MLTGLNNRRAFFEKSAVIDVNSRNRDCGYAVIIIDIDYFKKINDAHGHAVGDEVLKLLGRCLKSHLRATDIEGRIGGEEFAVTLVDTTLEQAKMIAEKLCAAIRKLSLKAYPHLKITVSCGVSVFTRASKRFADILEKADEALYRAKSAGRDCVVAI